MAFYSRFFGGPEGSEPEYSQVQFAEVLSEIFSNGVFRGALDEFEVTQNDPPSMSVVIKSGRGWINGYWCHNTEDLVKTLGASDPDNPRIDRIILRLDTTTNFKISAEVLTGTPAASPVAPTLTQTAAIWEISLAQVLVEAEVTSIVNANITDERTYTVVNHTPALAVPTTTIYPDKLNLVILYKTAATIDINADCLQLYDADKKAKAYTDIDLTLNLESSGANGLDTGTEAANTWYYIWVIGKEDGTVAGLFSESSTAPTMPTDYLYKRIIGAIRNDDSSNFVPGRWVGGWFYYDTTQQAYSGNGVSSYTDVDLSAFVPGGFSQCLTLVRLTSNTEGNFCGWRRNGDTMSYPVGAASQLGSLVLPVDENGIIEHCFAYTDRSIAWGVQGYKNIE